MVEMGRYYFYEYLYPDPSLILFLRSKPKLYKVS